MLEQKNLNIRPVWSDFFLPGYTFRGLQCVHVQLKYSKKNIHLFPDETLFIIKTGWLAHFFAPYWCVFVSISLILSLFHNSDDVTSLLFGKHCIRWKTSAPEEYACSDTTFVGISKKFPKAITLYFLTKVNWTQRVFLFFFTLPPLEGKTPFLY